MRSSGVVSTPEAVFAGSPGGLALYRAGERLLTAPDPLAPAPAAGPPGIRATKSQVAFHGRRRGFAYVWWPGRYVRSDVPAVLSIVLGSRIDPPLQIRGPFLSTPVDAPS